MENDYLLYGTKTGEVVWLGAYLGGGLSDFAGPILRLEEGAFYLPSRLLDLLVSRFFEANQPSGVVIGRLDMVYEHNPYLENSDSFVPEVGGECDGDTPLSAYLPEIENPSIIQEIVTQDALKLPARIRSRKQDA